jgi:hypothetical protein
MKETTDKAVEPTGALPCSFDATGDLGVTGFGGRHARAPVAHLSRSAELTP